MQRQVPGTLADVCHSPGFYLEHDSRRKSRCRAASASPDWVRNSTLPGHERRTHTVFGENIQNPSLIISVVGSRS